MQRIMLQRCSSCNAYLTLDSKEVSPSSILEKINGTKVNMRTITAQINGALYEKLEQLMRRETARDSSKIMSEIVALGIEEYGRSQTPEEP